MQKNKTPEITFGIKHSPLLGQLKPLATSRPMEKKVTHFNDSTNEITKHVQKMVVNENGYNEDTHIDRRNIEESNECTDISRTNVTHIRHNNDVRSTTVSPEPIHNQETLTQEIVWVPEQPIVRRGSYTIDKTNENAYSENYKTSDVVPVENGVIRTAEQGAMSGKCSEESSSKVIKREGFEQNINRHVKNATAHENKQTATEEVRSNTDVQKLENGGFSKTTTTTTIKKFGTAAKTANATTNVTRTATVVTSRDIGVK